MKQVKLTNKEINLLEDLLNVAHSGWYSDEVKPTGFKTPKEAEQCVLELLNKIKNNNLKIKYGKELRI